MVLYGAPASPSSPWSNCIVPTSNLSYYTALKHGP